MSEKIGVSVYHPVKKPEWAVLFVHGMCEHRKRYDVLAKKLCENGFGVMTFDLLGHGESLVEDTHGYFGAENGWQSLILLESEMVKQTRKEFPKAKLVIISHSMGTLITRCYLQKHDNEVDGVIMMGAPYYQKVAPMGLKLISLISAIEGKKTRSKLIKKIVGGNFNKNIPSPKTDHDWLSYNDENVQNFLNDPECGIEFTNQGNVDLVQLMVHMNNIKDYACQNASLPLMFMAGADDPCIGGLAGLQDSIDTLKKAGYSDIDKVVYKDARHEFFNEKNQNEVIDDIIKWIKEKVNNKAK